VVWNGACTVTAMSPFVELLHHASDAIRSRNLPRTAAYLRLAMDDLAEGDRGRETILLQCVLAMAAIAKHELGDAEEEIRLALQWAARRPDTQKDSL
jgi:hypothetical protein